MKCFVIAMESEAKPLFEHMTVLSDEKTGGKRVVTGTLCGEKTAAIVCGVGKVNAACGTQLAIDRLCADKIINVGVAGGLNGSLAIGQIYAVSAAVQYDFDLVQLNGTKIGTLDECTENYLPLSASSAFPVRRLATGDRFNDNPDDHDLLTKVLDADIRDMEGGAIAQACMNAGVNCRIYKAISDIYGSGSTSDQFKRNLALCTQALKNHMIKIWEECHGS